MKLTLLICALSFAVVVIAIGIIIWVKGARMIVEAEQRKTDLDTIYGGLMRKQRDLDLWEKQLRTSTTDFASSKKIWANYVVDDGNEDEHRIYKALAIKLGYAVMKFFGDRVRVTEKDDGRKVFSLEVNIIPFYAESKK
jgi:hypothetical protein